MLFSVKLLHKSALCIHIPPPFWTSLPSSSPSHPSRLIQSPCLSFLSHTANSRWLSIFHPANFAFDNLIKRFLDVNFFESILFGVYWGFWIYRLVFHQIWDGFGHYLFFQYVFYIFFFSVLFLGLSFYLCGHAWWCPSISQVVFIFILFFLFLSLNNFNWYILNFADFAKHL